MNRRYQRTASTITSGGNRNPTNADDGGDQDRARDDNLTGPADHTGQARVDHAFAQRNRAPDLKAIRGRLYETLSWQSPAFAEYGYGPDDDFRIEPSYETLHGEVVIFIDRAIGRKRLDDAERTATVELIDRCRAPGANLAVIFNGCDLSGTGGLWRSTLRDSGTHGSYAQVRQAGVEAITFLLLVTTLVYLDFAPEISWDHINFLYTS
ncbi:hypothetical protein ACIBCL_25295 [Micromonospora zamorensis]|uniref:hypothetical protein n=1 Tax=Micromonospora zamorensis TaxID=709883 RepID=UPI0037B81BE0